MLNLKDLDPVKIVYLIVISFLLIISLFSISYNISLSDRVTNLEVTQEYLVNEVDVLASYEADGHKILIDMMSELLENINGEEEK